MTLNFNLNAEIYPPHSNIDKCCDNSTVLLDIDCRCALVRLSSTCIDALQDLSAEECRTRSPHRYSKVVGCKPQRIPWRSDKCLVRFRISEGPPMETPISENALRTVWILGMVILWSVVCIWLRIYQSYLYRARLNTDISWVRRY